MDTPVPVRELIVHHHQNNVSERKIPNLFRTLKTTVHDIIQHFQVTGSYESSRRGRCGAKKVIDRHTDRRLANASKRNPRLTARQIQNEVPTSAGVSLSSIRRSLRRSGLVAYRPVKAPLLNLARKRTRLNWANRHRRWTAVQWNNVIFSDETAIDITVARSQYVRRLHGSPILDAHTASHRPFIQKVMFWGCVSQHGRGPLVVIDGTVTAAKYEAILQEHYIPYLQTLDGDEWVFQQDNAPAHTARRVQQFLQGQGITVLDWPPYSPDMNCIENVWAVLKRRVHQSNHTTRQQLIDDVLNIWNNDPDFNEVCRTVVESMPRRVRELVTARGGYTGY